MCGRTACALEPDAMKKACNRQLGTGTNKKCKAAWRDAPNGGTYYPSYNVCPGSYTPVLFAADHVQSTTEEPEEAPDYFLQPMMWGLVPSWSSSGKSEYSTNNARSESMLSKRTYQQPLRKGRRCVVLVQGYYEWQASKTGKKQPYYIYTGEKGDSEDEKPLLAMAGIFDVWHSKEDKADLFSYSVITVDSHKNMAWLHDRMPAVLHTCEAISDWLDHGRVPLEKATELIMATDVVKYHPVSTAVNTAKNKGEECTTAVDLAKEEKQKSASASFMQSWLKSGKRTSDDAKQDEEPQEKKPC